MTRALALAIRRLIRRHGAADMTVRTYAGMMAALYGSTIINSPEVDPATTLITVDADLVSWKAGES